MTRYRTSITPAVTENRNAISYVWRTTAKYLSVHISLSEKSELYEICTFSSGFPALAFLTLFDPFWTFLGFSGLIHAFSHTILSTQNLPKRLGMPKKALKENVQFFIPLHAIRIFPTCLPMAILRHHREQGRGCSYDPMFLR